MRERLALDIMFLVGRAFRSPDRTILASEISNKLRIPSIAMTPITGALEAAGLLMSTEQEELLPGREMARIKLKDILDVVRVKGETGSLRDPSWSHAINTLCSELDAAAAKTVGDRTLSDLLDEFEETKQ